jgi:hypothetical protein
LEITKLGKKKKKARPKPGTPDGTISCGAGEMYCVGDGDCGETACDTKDQKKKKKLHVHVTQ